MRRRPELLDVIEVAAVDDGEHSEQALEDSHRRLLEVLRVSRVCRRIKQQKQASNRQRKQARKKASEKKGEQKHHTHARKRERPQRTQAPKKEERLKEGQHEAEYRKATYLPSGKRGGRQRRIYTPPPFRKTKSSNQNETHM